MTCLSHRKQSSYGLWKYVFSKIFLQEQPIASGSLIDISLPLQKLFENILSSADVSDNAADQIALSINQQTSAFEQILQTLKQISEGVDHFVGSTKATTDASEKLREMADNLHTVIEHFVGQKKS